MNLQQATVYAVAKTRQHCVCSSLLQIPGKLLAKQQPKPNSTAYTVACCIYIESHLQSSSQNQTEA